jgi:radical SAM-linked protein
MNAWIRALRRAEAPLAYSHGFHPHPKVAFSSATPSGEETTGDYMDVVFYERVDIHPFLERVRATLPEGFGVLGIQEVPLRAPSLMGLNVGGEYTLFFDALDRSTVEERLESLLARSEVMVERRSKSRKSGKKKGRYRKRTPTQIQVDIRPMIVDATLRPGDLAAIDLRMMSHDGKPPKAREIVALLADDTARVRVLRRDTLDASGQSLSMPREEKRAPVARA